MRNVALTVSYDGTHFAGFQRQTRDRSVQGVLEEALGRLTGETPDGLRLVAAGRTDAGVHASGMVVNFHTAKGHPDDTWVRALNALLPDDVAVQAAREVDMAFHSRFSAIARSYRYQVSTRRTPDPLRRFWYHWEPRPMPEAARMIEAFEGLVGTHDFAAFGSTGSTPRSTVVTVSEARCQVEEGAMTFSLTAKSFLYHMVRRLVGAALQVGQGRLGADVFMRLVELPAESTWVPPTAPACGLTFVRAQYPPPWAEIGRPF